MHLRLTPTRSLTCGLAMALVLGAAPATAGESALYGVNPSAGSSKARPIFEAASAAAAQATTATTPPNDHQFGVGLRLGGQNAEVGASVRYFFYAGPLGVQAELSRYSVDLGSIDFTSVQFSPSAIYRFREHRFESPFSITPYLGLGLSFIHSNFDDVFGESDDTDVGVLIYGGVEFFFERVPNLGASGELTYISNDDIVRGGLGADIGGLALTAAAHWYFW